MLVQDISSAVTSLGEACELLAEEFGDKAPECAEAYFYYGKALLELSRVESGVLGNALDGVVMDSETAPTKTSPAKGVIVEDSEGLPIVEDAESLPTEKKAEIEEKVADALEENFDKHEMLAKAHNADNTEEMTEEDSGDDQMETDVEKNEEPGNLEQAWQMFDLAKVNLHTYCSVDINSCRLSMGKQRTK